MSCFWTDQMLFVIHYQLHRSIRHGSQTKPSLAGSVIQAMPLKGKGSAAAGEAPGTGSSICP